ncbi:LysR family transcriptional regulator [Paenibacillus sp. FSL R7-0273]|uniref:LysR substrate-binding domain-containing protein n=1 Tax=Paenibacillus sp. FSL R7-0273 TaxID=1536772 RepID=UPI0004F6A7B8|nr:LysR substrate-binding domain-containing protein [Paenibacillus sp. FSL R7-0273]AIQ47085.1 LysR family transcriptional regulator [Paenibacillus sp. FSL R7-0273]OMF97160.1 LysR family transcriptional regulator [Paenibacillus sp. FSL R7-0273]
MIVDALRVFVTVAEQRHFSRAGELLNLSQPGVSLHIRNLENELGSKLLHRSPKAVRLTEAGAVLFKHAKQILAHYEEAAQEIRLLRDEVTGSLNLGASFTIGEYILPGRLADYAGQYPQVDLQVTIGNTEEIIAAVKSNRIDIGFIEGETSDSELDIIPYMKDEMIVAAAKGHPLTAALAVDNEMLQDQVWVLREPGSGTRAYSDHFLQEAQLSARRSYVFNSSQGVKEAVAAGLGITLLSRWIVRKELAGGEISELRIRQRLPEREFLIIRRKEEQIGMASRVFLEKLLTAEKA